MDNGAVCGERTVAFMMIYFVLGLGLYLKVLMSTTVITDYLAKIGIIQSSASLTSGIFWSVITAFYHIITCIFFLIYFFIRIGTIISVTFATSFVIVIVIKARFHSWALLAILFFVYIIILQAIFINANQMLLAQLFIVPVLL